MEKLLIGKILKPQGIKGELKAEIYTDDAENFKLIKRVFLSNKFHEVKIENARVSNNNIFLTLEGLSDRNQAELMRGIDIYINRDDLPDLDEQTYYICDIIDCDVFDEEENFLGKVFDVLTECGGADVYVLKNESNEIMFPFLDRVVKSVSTEDKKIIVTRNEFDGVAIYED